jgi:hypothetical protein
VVVQSWILLHLDREYNANYTAYGYRPKEYIIDLERFNSTISSKIDFLLNDTNITVSNYSAWHHNYKSARHFRLKFDDWVKTYPKADVVYLYYPLLSCYSVSNNDLNNSIKQLGNHFSVNTLPNNYDSMYYSTYANWSDIGHYSIGGAITFTQIAEHTIKSF